MGKRSLTAFLLILGMTWGVTSSSWGADDAVAAVAAAKAKAQAKKETMREEKAERVEIPVHGGKPSWAITEFHSDTPGNVFYNSDVVKLGMTVGAREAGKTLVSKGGTWRIKEIEERDRWPFGAGSSCRVIETNVACAEGSVPAASGGKIPVTIEWKPSRMGSFGVYLKLDGAEEQMVWGFVVTYPPTPGRKPDSPVVWNLGGPDIPWVGPAYKRLGVKWIRGTGAWSQNEPSPGEWTWDTTDPWMQAARDNDLLIMDIVAYAPHWALPMIDGDIPVFYFGNKPEGNVSPKYLAQWQEWARRFVERYKDTVRAAVMMNEPWDGGGLSGWIGTPDHYCEIVTAFCQGAHQADPTFKVVGNDSSMNVEDVILPHKGTIDYMDGVSCHTFRSFNAFVVPEFAAFGKPVWDTESWIGAGTSNHVEQVTLQLAQGIVKTQPISSPDAFINYVQANRDRNLKANPNKIKSLEKKAKESGVPMPAAAVMPTFAAPAAQALSVFLHFIEDTDFHREPTPEAAPWMFVFQGRQGGTSPAPGKNAAVIFGRCADQKYGNFPWQQVKSDGTLTIADAEGALTAYDVKGNMLPRAGQNLQIPLTTAVYYVVSSKGADDLVQHLRSAIIKGLEPVQLALHDFTRPLRENPPLRVSVTNVYNVPVSGSIEVKAPEGWSLAAPSKPFADLKPGESTELAFEVKQTKAVAGNRYPFTITAKTDKGNVQWSEGLSETLLVKGTPPLDGTAADWQKLGALPVYLKGGMTDVDSFIAYAKPFLDLEQQDNTVYFVQFMGMWDQDNFYILADINDPTIKLRPSMAKGTPFTVHGAPNETEYWGMHPEVAAGGDLFNFSFDVLPYGEKQIANFPPAAQQKVAPKWRVNPADYEYQLYLGKQNKVPEGDYQKAIAEYRSSAAHGASLRKPNFVEVGPPVPELWRLMAPGVPRTNYLPLSPRAEKDQGLVPGAKLQITREGNIWHYRAAIPWTELSRVKPLAMEGRSVGFSFFCKNDGRTAVSWSNETRSIARRGQEVLHTTSEAFSASDTEWGFVDPAKAARP